MSQTSCARARRHIARAFVRGPASVNLARLHAHLATCGACATLYDDYAAAEQAAARSPHDAFLAARAFAVVLARLSPRPVARRWPWVLGAVPAALAAVAAAIVLLVLPGAPPPSARVALSADAALAPVATELVPRGARAPASDIGVRLFRVQGAHDVAPTQALRLSDLVTFTYTDVDPSLRYLSLFGLQVSATEAGRDADSGTGIGAGTRILWYDPEDPEQGDSATRSIATGQVDEPLGFGVRLAVEHTPGDLQIVALFASAPLSRAAIEAAVAEATEAAEPGLPGLPLTDLSAQIRTSYATPTLRVLEHSFMVHLEVP